MKAFPGKTYHTLNAKHQVLQMPLAALRLGDCKSGLSQVFLMEYITNLNYQQLVPILSVHCYKCTENSVMNKGKLQQLLKLACSDRERQCIKYAAYKASGLSVTAAFWYRQYG